MKAVEQCSCDSEQSDTEPTSHVPLKVLPSTEETDNAYYQLAKHCNEESQLVHDSSPSLLLPAFTPLVKEDFSIDKGTVIEYINDLKKERDDALFTARIYRNQVDKLQSKNRKLYCDMYDNIDTIRNFYRNDIAEGHSRAAVCVKLAFKNQFHHEYVQ